MSERRKIRRQRTILGGVISFNRRQSTSNCVIRNLTDDGALLMFENSALLPAEFDLTITPKETTLRARTVWRSPNAAGVAFSGQQTNEPVPLDLARKLRAAKTEQVAQTTHHGPERMMRKFAAFNSWRRLRADRTGSVSLQYAVLATIVSGASMLVTHTVNLFTVEKFKAIAAALSKRLTDRASSSAAEARRDKPPSPLLPAGTM